MDTVQNLASVINVQPERLVELLKDAGAGDKTIDDTVTFEEKRRLIAMLNTSEFQINQPPQTKEVIVQGSAGQTTKVFIKHTPKARRVITKDEHERRIQKLQEEKEQAPDEQQTLAESELESQAEQVELKDDQVPELESQADDGVADEVSAEVEVEQIELRDEHQPELDSDDVLQTKPDHLDVQTDPLKTEAVSAATEVQSVPHKEVDADTKGKKAKERRKDDRTAGKTLHVKNKRRKRPRSSKKLADETKRILDSHRFQGPTPPKVLDIKIYENNKVADLAAAMAIKASNVISYLMQEAGVMAGINDSIDAETAELAVLEFKHRPIKSEPSDVEKLILGDEEDDRVEHPRSPVVVVMGHVDHGKTTLLDYIRSTRVAQSEKGGITQRIGAYQADTPLGQMTFLDTPGHAAFTAMRVRGAQVADIVILVVAADDGVKPQTIEAINHAKEAGVPMIVAVNKMDKPKSSSDRISNELTSHEVIVERLGGDVQCVEVSALKGTGVDNLLQAVIIEAEVRDLTAPTDGLASGIVIESKMDKGRGPLATVLVQKGTIHQGDFVVSGQIKARARTLNDYLGNRINSATPSVPIEIEGWDDVPTVGDEFRCMADEKTAQKFVGAQEAILSKLAESSAVALAFGAKDSKSLKLVIKADVLGSAEALKSAMEQLSDDSVDVKVIHSMVGAINQSDVHLADAAEASILAFNVKPDSTARQLIDSRKIPLYQHNIIYDAIEEVKEAIARIAGPKYEEEKIGRIEVKEVFKFPKIGIIAGCYVHEGAARGNVLVKVIRDGEVIHNGKVGSLKRFTSDVSEVKAGNECGIGVRDFNDIQVSDWLEVYQQIEV